MRVTPWPDLRRPLASSPRSTGGKARQRLRGNAELGVCECHRTVILNAGVQVGEVNLILGSSDARRSRRPGDVPSPGSYEHWFKEI